MTREALQPSPGLDSKWGYTFDHTLGTNRPLNAFEHEEVIGLRQKFLNGAEEFIADNFKDFVDVLDGKSSKPVFIAFDEQEDYNRFIDDLFTKYGRPRGVTDSTIAVKLAVQVTPRLLIQSLGNYPIRPVELEDIQRESESIISPYSFDPAELDNLFKE